MSKLTPKQAQEKHNRNLKGSLPDMRIGINAVTEAPGKKAAEQADKMLANLTESVRSGKWANNVAAVTLEQWKSDMIDKGLGRVAAGIDASADKVESFFAELFPFQDTLQRKLETMPDLTLEDSIQRMTEWVRGMAGFSYKR